jgi:hypothetical protein
VFKEGEPAEERAYVVLGGTIDVMGFVEQADGKSKFAALGQCKAG